MKEKTEKSQSFDSQNMTKRLHTSNRAYKKLLGIASAEAEENKRKKNQKKKKINQQKNRRQPLLRAEQMSDRLTAMGEEEELVKSSFAGIRG